MSSLQETDFAASLPLFISRSHSKSSTVHQKSFEPHFLLVSICTFKVLIDRGEELRYFAFLSEFKELKRRFVFAFQVEHELINHNERVSLHPHRSGRHTDRQCLLGALLPRARHPGIKIYAVVYKNGIPTTQITL